MNNELTYLYIRLNKQSKKIEKIIELENQVNLIISKELLYWNSCDIGDADLHLYENVYNPFYNATYITGCVWNKKNSLISSKSHLIQWQRI